MEVRVPTGHFQLPHIPMQPPDQPPEGEVVELPMVPVTLEDVLLRVPMDAL